MKELDRLEKRIDIGGKVALAGAVLSLAGIFISMLLMIFCGMKFTTVQAVLTFTGPVVLGIGMCIMPSQTALMIARSNALWELRMRHAIKEARKSG